MDQHEIDLSNLKLVVALEKQICFDTMRRCLRMNATELQYSGYKSNEAALRGQFEHHLKKIEKLQAAYIKKYPD